MGECGLGFSVFVLCSVCLFFHWVVWKKQGVLLEYVCVSVGGGLGEVF